MYPAFIFFDYGLLAFPFVAMWVGVIGLAIWNLRRHFRRVMVSLAVYVLTYGALSINGDYVLANHGGAHWTRSWAPPLVVMSYVNIRSHIVPDLLAIVYWPLFVLDIWLWHPSVEPWEGYYEYWCGADNFGPRGC